MFRVSNTYQESMKSLLRERAYIRITFGLVNQEAQTEASLISNNLTHYSNVGKIFKSEQVGDVYATLEENFTKVDGSMTFLPRTGSDYIEQSLVTNDLISEVPYTLGVSLNIPATSIKGLTILFGSNYPVDFDIVSSSGKRLEVRGNTKSKWSTDEVFEDVTGFTITFTSMKSPQSRLRIYSMMFGYGLSYTNEAVIDSKMESHISPIGTELPQIDFWVQLDNRDKHFNVDNPNSTINYFETGQEMNIMYGYQLPNSGVIEWVKGNKLVCSAWESDDKTATIYCKDAIRNLEAEYFRGSFSELPRSYFDLATEVFEDAGVSHYYIDPVLKTLYTQNPVPRVMHKEALQIIANACRCVLTQNREGVIEIKSNFKPDVSVITDAVTPYSKPQGITENVRKFEYASLAPDYTPSDGTMHLLPKNGEADLETGYVSNAVSDENGLFSVNPVVTLTMNGLQAYHGVGLTFGNSLPSEFIITSYNGDNAVVQHTVREADVRKVMTVYRNIGECDKITIEFVKTKKPHNRIILHQVTLSDVSGFTMTNMDMTSYPRAIKQELIKEVVVPCVQFQKSSGTENVIYENISVTSGQTATYYVTEPYYGYSAKLGNSSDNVSILKYGDYYVVLQYNVSGDYLLEVEATRYKKIEQSVVKTLNSRGKTITWKNPLINTVESAYALAEWLGEYYSVGIEYEYETRGNPELDATDVIYQENEFYDKMKVSIYHHVIGFNQSFNGRISARRVGG